VTYAIKEIFYTLQGEGANAGTPAVFCRFAGCNLWSGRESDRAAASCRFCDTDFVGTDGTEGGRYAMADELADRIASHWPAGEAHRFVVLTGGEPLLQIDAPLIEALHARGCRVAVETNGTIVPPPGIDWLCVSPKAGVPLLVERGDELKVVWPQAGLDLADLEQLDFRHFFLQPLDDAQRERNTRVCIDACLARPRWRLSLQTHKMIGIR